MYVLSLNWKPNHFSDSLVIGTEKNALLKSMTENHFDCGLMQFSILSGSATSGVGSVVTLFTARRSCIIRYFPVFSFLTGNIGVKHTSGHFVSVIMPASKRSVMTGCMPSVASLDIGYWRCLGLYVLLEVIFTGGKSFTRPTSVGPFDHKSDGSALSSGWFSTCET